MSCSFGKPPSFVESGMSKDQKEAVEIVCPNCKRTEIVYITKEEVPKCEDCKVRMVIRELLKEGKSF